jgi:hypothetical protein
MKRRKILMSTTALPSSLLGKTPESMPRIKLEGSIHSGNCLIWLANDGRVMQLTGWDLKAA